MDLKETQVLGKLLVLKNIVSQQVLEVSLGKLEKGDSRSLDVILMDDFHVDRDKLYTEVAKLYAIPKANINPDEISQNDLQEITNLMNFLPKEVKIQAMTKRIIPYKIQKKRTDSLVILASIPTDTLSKQIAEYNKINRYEIFYCPFEQVDKIIQKLQTSDNEFLKSFAETEADIDLNAVTEKKKENEEDLLEQEINKGALVYLFEASLVDAVKSKVSDIHYVPFDSTTVDILYRIDGKLQIWKRKENVNPQAMFAVVKDRSTNIDRFKIDEPQDGFLQREVDGHMIRFRVSLLPIVAKTQDKHYESIVIRILDDRNVIDNIEDLGFLEQARKDFVAAINKPQGLIIVTGPTGSGKSTTLVAALYSVTSPEVNVLTVEDPVEYIIRGARQIKISPRCDFNSAIRAILRHDPDIVMVGEMRDKQTAEIGIKLANTGHLTFSTLHTNDAPSAVSRLFKMEIETFLIAYAINIIIAQRLVRRLCPKCKVPLAPEKHAYVMAQGITQEEIDSGKLRDAAGCDNCRGSGYKGRLGIHEVLYFTKELRAEIVNSKEDINEARIREIAERNGMLSLRGSGMELVRRGLTTIDEVIFSTTSD